ncbi:putative bifunctional diguanylate cyclase/phosphodiesterase [Sphingomonas lenta]|uniref:GGDEF-domain containing protein n=1 Tax=Sphingomonas lenta TaxID=1141887 RepID=A0A2A2SK05_9SPHN|nr:EAL domain-containing protein [Sphingomonas lenta]PAX09614.1 GGDEF-domain containing protein [Sphingomonas lenta]
MIRERVRPAGANTDFVSGLVTGAAILLFVVTASAVLSDMVRQWRGEQAGVDDTMAAALLLNIALILFGWFRHRRLSREVLALTEAGEHAKLLASRDALTGFLNRRSLAEDGAGMFMLAAKRRKALAVLMLDLDHFKTVNDLHGHAVGDALLKQVASEIQVALPGGSLAARLGGDEFACAMFFDPEHPDVVDRVAEQIVTRMARPFQAEGAQLHISGSVGIARSDQECQSFDALLRSADIAMYAAKNAGRNRHAWFDQSMERELQARNETERGLRAAVPAHQIVPYFESQIDLVTGRLAGFEVLARWEHPTRGLVSPDQFIRVAEEAGLIGELSVAIMRQAFTAARDWNPALTLSVNISPAQLKDAWLAQKIIKTLTETGFPANRLEVEITESSLFENLALSQSIVASLKNQGIKLALDDFGTGYSSLAHLRALPFDRIKIDKSFVASAVENPESAAIVNAIARLGDSLNLPVTAEGIEDAGIEARLRQMGCARGQGYLYGRPMSIAQVRRMLAEKRLLIAQADEPAPEVTSQRLAG